MKSKWEVIKEINSLEASDARRELKKLEDERGIVFAEEVLFELDIYKHGRWWIDKEWNT